MEADHKLIKKLLKSLVPEGSIIVFAESSLSDALGYDVDKYYGILHRISHIPHETIKKLKNVRITSSKIAPPPPLLHIPSKDDLHIENISSSFIPKLIKKSEGYEIWWHGHKDFQLPIVVANIIARNSMGSLTLDSAATGMLHAFSLKEFLDKDLTDYLNCGAEYSIDYDGTSYQIFIKGQIWPRDIKSSLHTNLQINIAFTVNHLEKILNRISSTLGKPIINDTLFQRAKQFLVNLLNDTETKMAFEHASDAAQVVSTRNLYSTKDILAKVKKDVNFNSVMENAKKLKNVYLQALIKGNIKSSRAVEIVESFIKNSGFIKLDESKISDERIVMLKDPVEIIMNNPIFGDRNHVTLVQYQYGTSSIPVQVDMNLIGRMLHQQIYNNLRTDKQLGYIVGANPLHRYHVEMITFIVQGSNESPNVFESSILEELMEFRKYLKNLSTDEFNQWKKALMSIYSTPLDNFDEELNYFWEEISSRDYCFTERELKISYLKNFLTSPKQLLNRYDELIQHHRRLVVKMFSGGLKHFSPLATNSVTVKKLRTNQSKGPGTRFKYILSKVTNPIISELQKILGFWPSKKTCTFSSLDVEHI